ncbi:MAG TPA: hypothetical protein VMZ53_02475 [Kofleriaceae bacterium]|nr:hypothetical protein [Kofleriaceae bacterium]
MKRVSAICVAIACALIFYLYWKNDDNAGQPDALRGGGEYLPILDRGDGHMLFLMARSTAVDHDWDFNNDLGAFGDPWGQTRNARGHKQIPHPIGPALVWTPMVWVAQAGAFVANIFDAEIPTHGYTAWHQRFVFLSSVICACLAILLGRRLAVQLLGTQWAPTYAAIAILLGTSITYYATNMPSYGHALDAGLCGAFLGTWALTIGQRSWRRWITLGLLLGVAALVRQQDFTLGIVVAVEIVTSVVADVRRRLVDWRIRAITAMAGGALVLLVALIVFIPQLYYWHVVYGDWLSMPQGARYTRFGSPMMLELLYSPRNGWFSTTPLAYAATLGLFTLPKRARLVMIGFLAVVFTQVYLNSTIIDWWGMASFGQRRLCSVTLILVVGLASLIWRCGRLLARLPRVPRAVWHVLAIVLLLPFIAWNLDRVTDLKAGKAAPTELEPTCCAKLPTKRPYIARPIAYVYSWIGNPFEFPANAYFALKHDVEIQRWDVAVGYYALVPPAATLVDDRMYFERGAWRIGYPKAEPYLIGGWSGPHMGSGKSFRWTTDRVVRVIVPNLMPYPQRLRLWLHAGAGQHAIIRWDDRIVARADLQEPTWHAVQFDLYDMPVGEHELSIESDVIAPLPNPPDGWPVPRKPVGVAVNLLELEFIPP